ncbi:MAG: ribonuclease Z [Thermococci archaeon]|nr:ribonuclease Z [Thermococci archaeon]
MMEVTFLGTGGIMPTAERNVPAIALRYGGETLLFDAGEGTIRQMNAAGLSPMKVSRIFITHFHGDHYLGLAALVQTMNLWNRTKPLHIYGPKYSYEFVKNLLSSGFFKPGFEIHVHELGEERIMFKGYEVQSFKVEHGVPALGYVFRENDRRGRFLDEKLEEYGIPKGPILGELERRGWVEWKGRKVRLEDVTGPKRRGIRLVYTGDTVPCERTRLFSEGADVLIHDATYINAEDRGSSYHSTIGEACEIGRKAGVRRIVLFHRSFRYSYDEYRDAAERLCDVPFTVPRDLDVIRLR